MITRFSTSICLSDWLLVLLVFISWLFISFSLFCKESCCLIPSSLLTCFRNKTCHKFLAMCVSCHVFLLLTCSLTLSVQVPLVFLLHNPLKNALSHPNALQTKSKPSRPDSVWSEERILIMNVTQTRSNLLFLALFLPFYFWWYFVWNNSTNRDNSMQSLWW